MPRILIIKTSSMGDVIHNLPVINDIHANIANTSIDWVVEEGFQDIPRLHSKVDHVIPVAIRRWRKQLFNRSTWQEIAVFKKQLSQHTYDVVLDTQGLFKSAFISYMANGPRYGQDKASARESLSACFYHHTFSVPREQHAVARNRQLAALALGYPLPKTPPDYGLSVGEITNSHITELIDGDYIVGLHATSRDSKLWPIEHWISLGKTLSAQGIQLLLPWGNDSEHHRANIIAASAPKATVLPRIKIQQIAAILAGAKAAVGVDTGLIHLAAALNLPTVAIYTDTQPALTGVLAQHIDRAINLGGEGQIPTPELVLNTLKTLINQ
ncbi:lipopolysaccharide heptosyltransferase I [Methylovorus sp. MM2]|uniref:lipopolysaccharide heptosyltransferase I n=1 Tax=Methylovorus sp. MM2 TaxID=1848038 RepID=UPI0007E1CAA1|nr:lipopolysaccharide heptosyltransferase I [Methylovorus sp. MM2]OAM52501.1 lipopolysaccharide heptosyltransferase I [Methylovorus sp. MM2]